MADIWDDEDETEDYDRRWHDGWDGTTLAVLVLVVIAVAYLGGHILVALSR